MIAAAPSRSATLRAKLAFVRGHDHRGRGAGFRNRHCGDTFPMPDFATLAALPDWLLSSPDEQAALAKAVAILLHRSAIDHELSGTKLAALSDALGEELFDQLCDCPLPDELIAGSAAQLPRPEDLDGIGKEHMLRAIPAALASRFPGAAGDEQASARSTIAAKLLQEMATEQ